MLTENKIKVNKHLLFNEITYIYTVNNQQKELKMKKERLSEILFILMLIIAELLRLSFILLVFFILVVKVQHLNNALVG